MVRTIAVDFGTTNTLVAYCKGATDVEIISNKLSKNTTPSVVNFTEDGIVTGEEAIDRRDLRNTVSQVKRFMGCHVTEDIFKRSFPYKLVEMEGRRIGVEVNDPSDITKRKRYLPEEILAYILRHMKALAREIDDVEPAFLVLTIPASFTAYQRMCTKQGAYLAGFEKVRLVHEPTAAVLAYAFNLTEDQRKKERVVLVYDLGGGTFDVSIVHFEGLQGTVIATAGLTELGGENFDEKIVDYSMKYLQQRGIDLDDTQQHHLRKSCEEAKRTLSTLTETEIQVWQDGKRTATIPITREEFEKMCQAMFKQTIRCVEEVMKNARVSASQIHDVVMVGGSSRIPLVRQLMQGELFRRDQLRFNIQEDHAVVIGAALFSGSDMAFSLAPSMLRRLTTAVSRSIGIREEQLVLVVDLGVATIDVSTVQIKKGKQATLLSTVGFTKVGGAFFDERILDYAISFLNARGVSLNENEVSGLLESCKRAKEALSTSEKAKIECMQGDETTEIPLTKQDFEKMCEDLFEKIFGCIRDGLKAAGKQNLDVTTVILNGGSTKMPKIRRILLKLFRPDQMKSNLGVGDTFAMNFALGDRSSHGCINIADILPHSIRISGSFDRAHVMLKKNSRFPCQFRKQFCNGEDNMENMLFTIHEGEKTRCSDNQKIYTCTIRIKPMEYGQNRVVVIFDIDQDGILHVQLESEEHVEKFEVKLNSMENEQKRKIRVNNYGEERADEVKELEKSKALHAFETVMDRANRMVKTLKKEEDQADLKKLIELQKAWFYQKFRGNQDLIGQSAQIEIALKKIERRNRSWLWPI